MRVLPAYGKFLRALVLRRAVLAPLLFLFFMSPGFAEEQPAVVYDTLVIVYFPSPSCNAFWPALKSELERSETPELLTASAVWITRDEFQKGMESKHGYEILLHGDCRMAASGASRNPPRGPLGWVLMVNGQIQPFVHVDCDRVRQMLHRELRDKTIAERRRILARAVSRIVVHEMTHIVTQNSLHGASGLEKAHVSSSDLLAYKPD
jgi:hypothetical protein